MKRVILAVLYSLSVVAIIVGLVRVRPQLIPERARIGPLLWLVGSPKAEPHCDEHGVPESFCTLCHPELKETLHLCREHGDIPEDICTLCNPQVAKQYELILCEHRLPTHFCPTCSPENHESHLVDDGWCATHNQPEELCGVCASEFPPGNTATPRPDCRDPLPLVHLASAEIAETAGIETADVREERHAHFLKANAETDYDANRYADINPRVAGYLREVRADLGQVVRAGEVLAVVDSPEISASKSLYLSSHAALELAQDNYDRTVALTEQDALPYKEEVAASAALNQARATTLDARQKLLNLGFHDDELAAMLETRDVSSRLNIISPIDGTVVLRHAVLGEAVESASQLFAVADTSTLWVWIDVYEKDIASVVPGQPMTFTISGTEGPTFEGRITWTGTAVSPTTRTIRTRAEVRNLDGRLRTSQFGRAEIRVEDEHPAVIIPKEAVQRWDKADLVFLPVEDEQYRPQRIVIRPSGNADRIEVVWGLKPGQKVVTTGAFLLKTEITPGAIGAGCAE